MSTQYSTSAALLFTEQELGGPCTENESFLFINSVTPQVIAQGNGDRVGLVVMNLGVNSAMISLVGIPAQFQSLLLAPSGGSVTLTVRDDFTLPSRQWSALGLGGSINLYVLEIVRYRPLENA